MLGLKLGIFFPLVVCRNGFDTDFADFSLKVCLWNGIGSSVSTIFIL